MLSNQHGRQVLLMDYETHGYLLVRLGSSTISQHSHLPVIVTVLALFYSEPIKQIRFKDLTSE